LTHEPLTQLGASGDVHWASPEHAGWPPPPTGVGLHTPLSQEKPSPHGLASQLVRHCPSAQILLPPHSLEYLHAFWAAVQAPATQVRPPEQSAVAVQGHGPEVPPHDSHVPALHALPSPQSALVEHSFFGPGAVPGAEQRPAWHVSPFGQVASVEQALVQPVAVQMDPAPQLAFPVQLGWAGERTGAQPYASQS
jgi:hypothetical protein